MTKKTQDLFIAIGLLLVGYFFGDTVAKINQHSPVKIPETIEEVREVDILKKSSKESNANDNTNKNTETIPEFDDARRDWEKMETVTVKYVTDGDTIVLTNGEKVRYTSIDTPERGDCWYRQAKRMNQDLVSGREIKLEQDISNRDKYERLLRYIYVDNKREGEENKIQFVNMELVKAGLARVKEYKPDLEYLEELELAESYAKQNKIGLWGGCEE